MQPLNFQQNLHTQFARYSIFLPQQVLGMLAIVKVFFEEFLIWYSRPIEVFFRHRFGVRGHGLFMTMQMTVTGVVGCWLLGNADPLFAFFSLAAAGMAIYHHVEAHRWEQHGMPPRYSWSHGDPIALWGHLRRLLQVCNLNPKRWLTVPLICRFGEPSVCLLLGVAVIESSLSPTLGAFLCCCSFAMLAKAHIIHLRMVNMQRDAIDARILSQSLIGMQRKAGGQQAEQQCFMVRLVEVAPPAEQEDDPDEQSSPDWDPVEPEVEPEAPAEPEDEEYVRLKCGNAKCRQKFKLHRQYIGRVGRCKKCGTAVAVTAQPA
jgi:hypothetical protein